MFLRFEKNAEGRDFVVGDIHGCFKRLKVLLDKIGFDPTKDRLFSVGDMIDRGPDSVDVLEWLKFPWFHAVPGNHEDMILTYDRSDLHEENFKQNGGRWFFAELWDTQQEIRWALSSLPYMIEVDLGTQIAGVVHSNVPYADWDYAKYVLAGDDDFKKRQHIQFMLWDRTRFDSQLATQVMGVDRIFVGHNQTQNVLFEGNMIYLDTGGYTYGKTYKDEKSGAPYPSPFTKGLTVMDMVTLQAYHEGELV